MCSKRLPTARVTIMRFACQSCGKAYNLPEERIAEKSNVKLKCRVCGAIVEVKRQGEVVAHLLDDVDPKRGEARVSEAPAALTSISPDDPEDATHAIAVSDSTFGEERGLPPLPPPPATGFGPSSLPPPPPRVEALGAPEALGESNAAVAPPLPDTASLNVEPSPAAPGGPVLNGSNASANNVSASSNANRTSGAGASHAPAMAAGVVPPLAPPPPLAEKWSAGARSAEPARSSLEAAPPDMDGGVGMPRATAGSAPPSPPLSGEASSSRGVESDDTNKKMIAAFLTGIVVDRIIAGLFF